MKELQLKFVARRSAAVCVLLLAAGTQSTQAQVPGPHPAYLHAIQDLREARALLDHKFNAPVHIQAAAAALPEIDAAIRDLKSAAQVDDKSLGDMPRPDPILPDAGRFHKVNELLNLARRDISQPESDPAALALQSRTQRHLDGAINDIRPAL